MARPQTTWINLIQYTPSLITTFGNLYNALNSNIAEDLAISILYKSTTIQLFWLFTINWFSTSKKSIYDSPLPCRCLWYCSACTFSTARSWCRLCSRTSATAISSLICKALLSNHASASSLVGMPKQLPGLLSATLLWYPEGTSCALWGHTSVRMMPTCVCHSMRKHLECISITSKSTKSIAWVVGTHLHLASELSSILMLVLPAMIHLIIVQVTGTISYPNNWT